MGRVVDRGFSGGDGRVGRDVWGEVRSIQNKKKRSKSPSLEVNS